VCRFRWVATGEWVSWSAKVPQVEVETHKVAAPDVVIPTVYTVRHESLLSTLLFEHKPMVLCGPPGSGKTMTLFSALLSTARPRGEILPFKVLLLRNLFKIMEQLQLFSVHISKPLLGFLVYFCSNFLNHHQNVLWSFSWQCSTLV
jgi:hypothetical protein